MVKDFPDNMPQEESPEDQVDARADFILGRLGFSWEDLRGKKILDIGAGSAEFGAAARKKGIEVVSLDRKLIDDEGVAPYQKEGYVQGSGDHLPFADESFDIVVSHASIPLHAAFDRKDVSRFIEEIRRVLKKGGECRFGPVGVGGAFFPVGDPEERASGVSNASWAEDTVDERVRKTSLKTTALLRELVPDLKNSTDDLLAQTNNFYSFVK